jgi:tRNA (guanine37-N1)-methyltransferase
MRIDILSVVPELLVSPLNHSIMKRAQDKGLFEVVVHNLREYGLGKNKQVDDYQFGGGAGMVMKIERIAKTKTLRRNHLHDTRWSTLRPTNCQSFIDETKSNHSLWAL